MAKRKPVKAEPTPAANICPVCGNERDTDTCWKCGGWWGFTAAPQVCPEPCLHPLNCKGYCERCDDYTGTNYYQDYDGDQIKVHQVEVDRPGLRTQTNPNPRGTENMFFWLAGEKLKKADPKMAAEALRLIYSITTGQYAGAEGKARLRGRYLDLAKEYPGVDWEENVEEMEGK